MTETELIQQATVGDPLAMRRLYDRYAPRVFAVVRRMAGDDDLAQDYAQDAWMRAFRALPSFRGDARFSTWIHRIAVNSALQAMRQGRRKDGREESLADNIPEGSTPGDTLLERRLEEAMDRLPQGMREILVLHDVEGYTHEEIADALGIAPGTSKSQLFKARVRMRGLLTGSIRTHLENHAGGESP